MNDPGRKIEIKGIEKITDRRFVNLFEMRYLDRQGNEKQWVYASRNDPAKAITGGFDLPDAVIIAAYHTEHRKLVIIKEFRLPIAGDLYGLPAGLIDPGEDIETCTRRELYEETGLELTQIRRISPVIYSSSGMTDESVVMVYADCIGEPSNRNAGSTEDIETVLVSREEAGRLCSRTDLKFDVKTWLVLNAFAESGAG